MNKETTQKAAQAITDQGVNFNVNEYEFCIRKLKLGTLVLISELSQKLTETSDKTTLTHIVKAMANDAPVKARIIAIAIVNSQPIPERPKKKLFDFKKQPFNPKYLDVDELSDFFLKTLDSEETNNLTNIILSQMGINDFFQSTVSLTGIDLLKEISKTVTDQPLLSGEE